MPGIRRPIRKPQKPAAPRWSPTPRAGEREKKAKARTRGEARLVAPMDRGTYVRSLIREIKDFPKPGILFRDITPLIGDAKGLAVVLDWLVECLIGEKIEAVVAIESRGFILGGALAGRLNASFIPVRKAGKLPFRADRVAYALEYGEATIEMHKDALMEGSRVVVVDDLLATGGTAAAAIELARRQGAVVVAALFLIELAGLGGRAKLESLPVISLVRYE